MKKIPTIFDRNWQSDRKVNATLVVDFDFEGAIATEKIDGTNIRITMRSGTVVRIEKRRNPSKLQKQEGISEPWYMDADPYATADKWIFDAVKHTDLAQVPDGEWSAEAYGKNIQGNPLKMDKNQVFLFSLPSWRETISLTQVPHEFDALRSYLFTQKSSMHPDALMEGIVWHHPNGQMAKIKRKDFAQ